jgi:hypothetical protein
LALYCAVYSIWLTSQPSRRAAITGEVSVKPYPFCKFKPIACIAFFLKMLDDQEGNSRLRITSTRSIKPQKTYQHEKVSYHHRLLQPAGFICHEQKSDTFPNHK